MNFLNKYNLLYLLQSGFRLNHSCQTALAFMIDRWLKAVDKGELIGAAFLDFAKAFDLLDHEPFHFRNTSAKYLLILY
jgi:hypothetical protein